MKAFLLAIRFLTIIPAGRSAARPDRTQVGASVRYYPLVGLLLGGLFWAFFLLVDLFFPLSVSAGLLLAFWVIVTGALHLDGLADALDGFYAGKTPQERLRIMKDVHVGTMGLVGLILVLGLKYILLKEILSFPALIPWLAVLPLVSRWTPVFLGFFFPYARPEGGLGRALVEGSGKKELLAASVTALGFGLVIAGVGVLGLLLFCIVWSLACGWLAARKLKGITGDIMGAVIETSEVWGMLYILKAPLHG
jgi:adenosylcobinamide-GDP ribazoletransferase